MTTTEGHEKRTSAVVGRSPPVWHNISRDEGRGAHCAQHGGPAAFPSEGRLLSQEPGSLLGLGLRQLPNKLNSFLAPPSARLNRHNHEPATRGRRQFGAGGLLVPPGCKDSPVNISGMRLWFAGTPQHAPQCPPQVGHHQNMADPGPKPQCGARHWQEHSCP